MADIPYEKAAFLHWESHPSQSRERLTPTQDVRAGDLLILSNAGYEVFTGTKITPKAEAKAHEPVVAVALAAGKAQQPVPCVVRNAVLLQDKINQVKSNAFAASQPLEALLPHFARQLLQVRSTIEAEKAVIA